MHFDGSPQTAWAKTLVRNSQIAIHLPDAEKVVVIYDHAQMIEDDELDEQAWHQLDSTYQKKYGVDEGRHIGTQNHARYWLGTVVIYKQ